jgi:16S rRNA (guanine527-N7)-methyltransferase
VDQSDEFSALLERHCPGFDPETRARVVEFRKIVVRENENQNLTRLLGPVEFLEGHVIDVRELLQVPVAFPALDLGSGAGVPGLLSALVRKDAWVLAESEGNKAAFLERAVQELGVESHVRVFSGRAEEFLLKSTVETVACRAVGPIERIMGWIGKCSTWNNLLLFKGPRWEEEWLAVQNTKWGKSLRPTFERRYELPISGAKRILVGFERVPRGTKQA